MSRAARIVGVAVGLFPLVGAGGLSVAMLAIRAPLADGGNAPAPDATAYAILLTVVLAGALGLGVIAGAVVELLVRFTRPR
ncbi:hypothetical protein BH09PSE4_BH09PSE4_07570 [soil metagenome]